MKTYDALAAEVARTQAELVGCSGTDRAELTDKLARLEKEQYKVLAKGRTPQNHATYVSSRDQERAAILRDAIARINQELAGIMSNGFRALLEGDRERLIAQQRAYETEVSAPTVEATEISNVLGEVTSKPESQLMADNIQDGETVCEHNNRPFDCQICFSMKLKYLRSPTLPFSGGFATENIDISTDIPESDNNTEATENGEENLGLEEPEPAFDVPQAPAALENLDLSTIASEDENQ